MKGDGQPLHARQDHRGLGEQRQEDERDSTAEDDGQQEAVQQRTAISVHVVYEAISAEGEAELKRSTSALAFSGLAAGLSMGFSMFTQALLETHLPRTEWSPLVARFGYAIGFLIVILGRQQLFTENTLTPIIPLLKHRRLSVLKDTLRLWAAVFLSNWVGTMAIAWVFANSGIVEEAARPTFLRLAEEALRGDFWLVVLKGIFAGWLIALLVWLLPFAETGRIAVILLMTYVIALGQFRHVVAGSVDTFYLVALGKAGWGEYLGKFMVPTLLGNIVGGVSLVAVLNHAQVHAGTAEGG